jgi:hypothetical protein
MNRDQLLRQSATTLDDNCDECDECARPMLLTGNSLCDSCHEWDLRRLTCIVCGGPKVFLDDETCSDRCDLELEGWPEP